jgi:hypothetical protein
MTRPNCEHENSHTRKLLHSLVRELFQTETSATQHCRREAERLGDTLPAGAMRAVAEHAESVLRELPGLIERESLPVSRGAMMTGAFFSELRDKMLDRMISSERSYRGTLLGVRHGLDVVRTLRSAAEEVCRVELFSFCESWLTARTVLVEELEEQLHWFTQHPELAVRAAHPLLAPSRSKQPSAS